MKTISVLFPKPFNQTFSYKTSNNKIKIGSLIKAPFGNKIIEGIVWFHEERNLNIALKEINEIIDQNYLSQKQMRFIQKFSEYNFSKIGLVLQLFYWSKTTTNCNFLKLREGLSISKISCSNHLKIINFLQNNPSLYTALEVEKNINIPKSIIYYLLKKNIIEKSYKIDNAIKISAPNITLSKEQLLIYNDIDKQMCSNYKCILLHGETGSGKTEIYLSLIYKMLSQNKQVLILLPEIILTTQWLDRFQKYYGFLPESWHSQIKISHKNRIWPGVKNGSIKLIVGTRSALFLPFQNLGCIIVDEEHDNSYKQEDRVYYSARDMAVLKASIFKIPILLVSATPSLETYHNSKIGKYIRFSLKNRYHNISFPKVECVDIFNQKNCYGKSKYFSKILIQKIKINLKNNLQSLLFFNRRGYASFVYCKKCKQGLSCQNCDAWLNFHKEKGILLCHLCSTKFFFNNITCSQCNSKESFDFYGEGIEKITEEIKLIFPKTKICTLSSDVIEEEYLAKDIVEKITNNYYNVIIGTQIISKGLHFPYLNLVGILNSNTTSFGIDHRNHEKAYQLFHQVAGRAGREKGIGEVIIQTENEPSRSILTLKNNNFNNFYEEELKIRKKTTLPPFSKHISIIIASENIDYVKKVCKKLTQNKPLIEHLKILGPIPSYREKIKNKFRWRFLLQMPKNKNYYQIISSWLNSYRHYKINIQIDVDPYNFY